MSRAQIIVLLLAAVVVSAINIPDALPQFHKVSRQPVGAETVSAYVPDAVPFAPTVAVQQIRGARDGTPPAAGERVAVFIRSGYRDEEVQRAPRLTLATLVAFGGIFCLVTRLQRGGGGAPTP
jgi:hypothetical protein